MSEIVSALRPQSVGLQFPEQCASGEDVVAHGRINFVWLAGNSGSIYALLVKTMNRAVEPGFNDPEFGRKMS